MEMTEDSEDLSWMLETYQTSSSSGEITPLEESVNNGGDKLGSKHTPLPNTGNTPSATVVRNSVVKEKTNSENCIKSDISTKFEILKQQSEQNKEILRKLKLVKLHKKKNNLDTLQKLIEKWRSVCQEALSELVEYSQNKTEFSMHQLIQYLAINESIVKFDRKTNSFIK